IVRNENESPSCISPSPGFGPQSFAEPCDWLRAENVRFCAVGGLAAAAPVPRTACFAGTTAGVKALTGALATSRGSTFTAFLATGCAEVNACGVASATAPGTL